MEYIEMINALPPECLTKRRSTRRNKPKLSQSECELELIKANIEVINNEKIPKQIHNSTTRRIFSILTQFIARKKFICYGGSALNAILPKADQFYGDDVLPDYDVLSIDALNDAKELVDIYISHGFDDVEARSGMHLGTFKVFVNFIGVLDLTEVHPELYDLLKNESIRRKNILYAPPLYLRMSMHLELSSPLGDITRWEKVATRLQLLNKHYPFSSMIKSGKTWNLKPNNADHTTDKTAQVVYEILVKHNAVFFGEFALSCFMGTPNYNQVTTFDAFVTDPANCAVQIRKALLSHKGMLTSNSDIVLSEHPAEGDIIPEYVSILTANQLTLGELKSNQMNEPDTVIANLYMPIACHNYNEMGKKVQIATVDTCLCMMLALYYSKSSNITQNAQLKRTRILTIASEIHRLSELPEHRLFTSKGIWRRYGLPCFGEQSTLETIRSKKAEMFAILKKDRTSDEFNRWFLRYSPGIKKTRMRKKVLEFVGIDSPSKVRTMTKRLSKTRVIE